MTSLVVRVTTSSMAVLVTIRSRVVPVLHRDLRGNQSDYTFASSADGLTITITNTVTNDVDTVTGVETLADDGDIGCHRTQTVWF